MTTILSGADSSVEKGEKAAEELTEAIEALQVKVRVVYIYCECV